MLPPHVRRLLDSHMATLGDTDPQFFPNLFFDISQKAEYRRTKEQHVLPTLLQNTILFNVGTIDTFCPRNTSKSWGGQSSFREAPRIAFRGQRRCAP